LRASGFRHASLVLLSAFTIACQVEPTAVLERHGWRAARWVAQFKVTIGEHTPAWWEQRLLVSARAEEGYLIKYDIGPTDATVLVSDGEVVGAWLETAASHGKGPLALNSTLTGASHPPDE
jgi:hypothetical protein